MEIDHRALAVFVFKLLSSNMDKPCHWVIFSNYIFNPMFEFSIFYPKRG